jgi:hypothetical protein
VLDHAQAVPTQTCRYACGGSLCRTLAGEAGQWAAAPACSAELMYLVFEMGSSLRDLGWRGAVHSIFQDQ